MKIDKEYGIITVTIKMIRGDGMYSNLMLILLLILPIPMLIRGLKKGAGPYRTILEGAVLSGVGIAFIFVIAQVSGQGIGAEIDNAIGSMAKALADNDQMTQVMGMSQSSTQERIDAYKALYEASAQVLPSALLIMGLIISWIEGMILGRAIKKDGVPLDPVPPFREFTLPRNTIFGWFIIYIISWILKAAHFSGGEFLLANVNILFQFTFALQGMALAFHFSYLKRIPKVVPVIVVIVLWLTSIGHLILFFAGILDLFLGLKKRIKGR
ncbi:MAG: DUF2232 domain-containing protein [Eubacteriaceae bacterium]|nr:DUF2232 domain-containing protein [Eubacteriaceae bacterium]